MTALEKTGVGKEASALRVERRKLFGSSYCLLLSVNLSVLSGFCMSVNSSDRQCMLVTVASYFILLVIDHYITEKKNNLCKCVNSALFFFDSPHQEYTRYAFFLAGGRDM